MGCVLMARRDVPRSSRATLFGLRCSGVTASIGFKLTKYLFFSIHFDLFDNTTIVLNRLKDCVLFFLFQHLDYGRRTRKKMLRGLRGITRVEWRNCRLGSCFNYQQQNRGIMAAGLPELTKVGRVKLYSSSRRGIARLSENQNKMETFLSPTIEFTSNKNQYNHSWFNKDTLLRRT